jgi:hypothetical protein
MNKGNGNGNAELVDRSQVASAVLAFADPAQSFELRSFPAGKPPGALRRKGDDVGGIVEDALALASRGGSVYFCVNPSPLALDRNACTKDADVTRRRWAFLDIDPVIPAEFEGDPASQGEVEAAHDLGREVVKFLEADGWLEPDSIVDSGRGFHAYWACDLPADDATKEAVSTMLDRLGRKFNGPRGTIDRKIRNASRVMKLPGTLAVKGDESPGRPYRRCQFIQPPRGRQEFVMLEQIRSACQEETMHKPGAGDWTTKTCNGVPGANGSNGRYYLKALEEECAVVAATKAPGRNDQLNKSALKLGHYVPGHLSEEEVVSALLDSALSAGLSEGEARSTIRSGMRKGMSEPKDKPPSDPKPRASANAEATAKRDAGPTPAEDSAEDTRKPNAAQRIVEAVAKAGVKLFHSKDGDAYGFIPNGEGGICHPLGSASFKRWVRHLLHKAEGAIIGAEATTNALAVLEGMAVYDGPEEPVFLRVGEAGGKLYLDPADSTGNAVEIDGDGWRVGPSPVRFPRRASARAMPVPQSGGNLDQLRGLINVRAEDWPLLLGWLFGCFLPRGPFPLLTLSGEQGTAKTTSGKMLQKLIDPTKGDLRSQPKDEDTLVIGARHAWLLAFDNFSNVPRWLSDALARLSTGGGLSKRTLYTDDEETVFDQKRPALITSIEDVVTSADVLDRAVRVMLEPIPDDERKTEAEVWEAFDLAAPQILGAMLTAISAGLRIRPTLNPETLPRMADFALWAEACCQGAGLRPNEFLDAYERNRQDSATHALEASIVATILLEWLSTQSGPEIKLTASNLLEALKLQAGENRTKKKDWPSAPHILSGRLKRDAPALRRVGVVVEADREKDARRSRFIKIRWKPASGASADACGRSGDREASDRKCNPDKAIGTGSDISDASDAVSAPMGASGYGDPNIVCPF